MLRIHIPDQEDWDERNETFVSIKGQTLQLEHSLVSISKWESKWHKAFLSKRPKTREESLDYIRCMTITQNVDPIIYKHIPGKIMAEIDRYISEPMTAVYFHDQSKDTPNRDTITAEVIYYWMISNKIPFECQKWHLNRLLALIRVCSIKNAPKKKGRTRDILSQQAAINAARKKQLNTKG